VFSLARICPETRLQYVRELSARARVLLRKLGIPVSLGGDKTLFAGAGQISTALRPKYRNDPNNAHPQFKR